MKGNGCACIHGSETQPPLGDHRAGEIPVADRGKVVGRLATLDFRERARGLINAHVVAEMPNRVRAQVKLAAPDLRAYDMRLD